MHWKCYVIVRNSGSCGDKKKSLDSHIAWGLWIVYELPIAYWVHFIYYISGGAAKFWLPCVFLLTFIRKGLVMRVSYQPHSGKLSLVVYLRKLVFTVFWNLPLNQRRIITYLKMLTCKRFLINPWVYPNRTQNQLLNSGLNKISTASLKSIMEDSTFILHNEFWKTQI